MNFWTIRPLQLEYFAFGFVLALLAAALGIWLGLQFWPGSSSELPGLTDLNQIVAARQAENEALQAQIDSLRAAMKGDVCKIDPGKLPAVPNTAVNQQAQVSPAQLPPPPNGQQPFTGNLAQLLDQATVLIVAPSASRPGSLEVGSGFFIAADTIMTNDHVIQNADPKKVFVFSTALGKSVQASVTARSGSPQIGGPDYAVLAVPPQMNIQPLALTTSVTQLEPVVAAGFPGAEEEMDRSFELLLNGAASTVPPVILTDGRISAIQTSDVGYKILPHTAQISKGNSGGPLVDQCGRVVGIDTFESVQQDEAVHLNYALEASDAAAFLKSKHINVTVVNGACTGAAAAPAQRAQTAAPT